MKSKETCLLSLYQVQEHLNWCEKNLKNTCFMINHVLTRTRKTPSSSIDIYLGIIAVKPGQIGPIYAETRMTQRKKKQ